MKTLFLFLLALPFLAHAAGPEYKIPRDATANQETCTTVSQVSRFANGAWGDWATESVTETHRLSFWNDGEVFYSLQEAADGTAALYSELRETFIDRTLTRRERKNTAWAKSDGTWSRQDYVTLEEVRRADGQFVRITETTNGRSLQWEIRTYGEDGEHGDHQVSVRTLMNPEGLNDDQLRVQSRLETCRFRVGG